MSENPLTRLSTRNRVSPEAEASILGGQTPTPAADAAPEPEAPAPPTEQHRPALVPATQGAGKNKLAKVGEVDYSHQFVTAAATSQAGKEEVATLNVRVPISIRRKVDETVYLQKAKGVTMTIHSVVTDALRLYFGMKPQS